MAMSKMNAAATLCAVAGLCFSFLLVQAAPAAFMGSEHNLQHDSDAGVPSSSSSSVDCKFDPSSTLPTLNNTAELTVQMHCTCLQANITNNPPSLLRIRLLVEDASIAEPISESSDAVLMDENDRFIIPSNMKSVECYDGKFTSNFTLKGKFLGHTVAYITIINATDEQQMATFTYKIAVQRRERPIDTIFVVVVALLVALNTVNMGMQIDLEVVRRTIRKPLAPAIGMACQFGFMPICALIVGKIVFSHPYYQLGLFTLGCAPGGGASNFWTYLFAGDLDLSVTMTFISTVGAMAMMPLWLYTIGQSFGTSSIKIPFHNLVAYLVALVVPIAIGVLIRKKYPSFTDKSRWLIRPLTVGLLLFIFTFGIYANTYMFYLMTWQVLLAGLLLSWLGYAAGALAALAARQSVHQIIAISIETGVQNTGIAIIILRLSLPQPDGDLASVVPVTGSIMVFIPLFLCWCKKTLREKYMDPIKQRKREAEAERTRQAASQLVERGIVVDDNHDEGEQHETSVPDGLDGKVTSNYRPLAQRDNTTPSMQRLIGDADGQNASTDDVQSVIVHMRRTD